MPLINYAEPMTFCDAVDAAAIILQICMTKLRDEAQFRDDDDHAPLNAAHLLLNMLEDTSSQVEPLACALERKLMRTSRKTM